MTEKILFSGIQPTGEIHLGNYLGALKNWVDLQNQYYCYYAIVDLHAITVDYDPQKFPDQILNTAMDLLAIGVDPKKSILFVQSHVPEHTELCWLFNTLTPIAELERMTQFKDKASRQIKNINLGLFAYPVLQAADILLYHGQFVPVGEDQIQHIELTRAIARWFNNKYKTKYFPETKPLLTPAARIMSLTDPTKKMSKSLGDKHWLGVAEPFDAIFSKIKKAPTTSEGLKNLQAIYEAFSEDMKSPFNPAKMSETKRVLAEGISRHFAAGQKTKNDLLKNENYVNKVLADGQSQAQAIASKTITEVKKIIGVG